MESAPPQRLRQCQRPRPRGGARRRGWAPAVGLLMLAPLAAAQDLELSEQELRWRVLAEDFFGGGDDQLGAIGVHLDWLDAFDAVPGSYVGLGGYGSLAGDRAGAFHAGVTAGWRRELRPGWWFDVGAYGGAGGGDESENGRGDWAGGLVLRPHIGIEHRFESGFGVRAEWSHVNAPGGDLGSSQIALGLTLPERLLRPSWAFSEVEGLDLGELLEGRGRLGLGALTLFPSGGSRRRDGTSLDHTIALATGTLERSLGPGRFALIELGAAAAGEVPGYLQALLGFGLRGTLVPETLDWRLTALAGAAGGGGVDTGGGLLLGARAGVETSAGAGEDWRFRLTAGYAIAPDGELDGGTLEAGIEWSPRPLEVAFPGQAEGRGLNSSDIELESWELQALGRSLALDSEAVQLDGSVIEEDIQLVGIGGVRELSDRFDLSLRAAAAVEGKSGGFRMGEIGVRYDLRALQQIDNSGTIYVQYHLGTGGGGGVDLGSGPYQTLGVGWHMEPRGGFRAGFEFETLHAFEGDFDAQSFALALGWDLAFPRLP